ncbi:CaiB/BaiF CoA transferase family protein [Prauserella rugosa]|uniref:Crotonobetainyl-CoA:carnitine CoA-transferase CaiB-like acyl-CoA transferase n=1 Tax=Prauserella rugosa TaxID=43354 RepID=A0A660C5A8_9PSEU|nr:CoA transferase [Prauserella rugosa]TWH18750.1 crotonobetainyl-CoA:carnitine CoA-transferase CaiB-like acyl-CoA transferase [Prauserella rugosa]
MTGTRRTGTAGPPAAPLQGLTVVDMSTSYAGPTASMYLADLGADVIKVERPGAGDDARYWGPPFVDGTSAWFASANRNKRSIALDLRSEDGLAAMHRLIADADVFIESMNPGKLERFGLAPADALARHPHLIYCAMSGMGLTGPDAQLPGYDLVAQARSGLMSVTGPAGGSPERVSTALSDIVTGMSAALAISAAVVRQRRTGTGDVIDVSLLDSDLALMAPRIASYLAGEPEPAPSGGTDSVIAIYQPFATADREIVVALGNDAIWRRFCAAAGLTELADDERLADNAGRRRHRAEIVEAIAGVLRGRTAEHWLSVLHEAGVPVAPVQRLSEVVSDSQVVARQSVLPSPGGDGALNGVRSPFRLGSLPQPRNERFPELGEHTVEILRKAGFDDAEIARLLDDGSVQASPDTAEQVGS